MNQDFEDEEDIFGWKDIDARSTHKWDRESCKNNSYGLKSLFKCKSAKIIILK